MQFLKNENQSSTIGKYLDFYLKKKSPDCILYSNDGFEFQTHKELFGQTSFMRELLKSANCCGVIEIFFPFSQEELSKMIEFMNYGKLYCGNEIEVSKVFENLTKILGFPNDLDSPGKCSIDDANQNDLLSNTNLLNTEEKFSPKIALHSNPSISILITIRVGFS